MSITAFNCHPIRSSRLIELGQFGKLSLLDSLRPKIAGSSEICININSDSYPQNPIGFCGRWSPCNIDGPNTGQASRLQVPLSANNLNHRGQLHCDLAS